MAPTKKIAPKSTAKKAPSTAKKAAAKRPGLPPRHKGPTSSRKLPTGGTTTTRPSTNEKGLTKVHCHAVYQYLTAPDQKMKKSIMCSDGRQIKNLQGFDIGPVVFGLPQDHCVLYNARIPLPTDHDEDGKWLKTIAIERLNGLLASTGEFDVDIKYEEECIEHYVKTLIAAVNKKYVVGKDRLKNIEFFRAIVKEKLTHREDGACVIAADHEEWAAAQQTIMMLAETQQQLAETTATSFKTLTEETQKGFTLLSGAVATNKRDISNLKTGQGNLESAVATNKGDISNLKTGHDELEARFNAIFGTPAKSKAKAAFVKTDRTGNSIDDLINEQEDDFDGEEETNSTP